MDSDPRQQEPRPRRGVALPTAMMGIVVLTVMVSGMYFVSTHEYRGARNSLVEQRAFAVAEFGLNSEISNWDRSRNLISNFPIGRIDSNNVYVAVGDTARVKVSRLTDNTFWVVSEGGANIGSRSLESRRRTNAMVRIAYPSIDPKGAITTAGDITLTGSADVNGYEHRPANWPQCNMIPGDTVPAILATPTANVNYKPQNITSSPAVVRDTVAADSNTYVRFGSETWNSLVSNADIDLGTIGSVISSAIGPVAAGGVCVDTPLNWGEPINPGVAPCYGRFPIIYSPTSLKLNSNSVGQGILLVNGDLEINGGFEFYGIVIVRDDIKKSNGNAKIVGAVYAANAQIGDPSFVTGNQDIFFSRCAVESALQGSAILTRVIERHWTQIF